MPDRVMTSVIVLCESNEDQTQYLMIFYEHTQYQDVLSGESKIFGGNTIHA